jgi:hypothetical protein
VSAKPKAIPGVATCAGTLRSAMFSNSSIEAAVDVDDRALKIITSIAGEVSYHVRDFFGPAEASRQIELC